VPEIRQSMIDVYTDLTKSKYDTIRWCVFNVQ